MGEMLEIWCDLFVGDRAPCRHMERYRPPRSPAAQAMAEEARRKKQQQAKEQEDSFYAGRRMKAMYRMKEDKGGGMEMGEQVAKELWMKVRRRMIVYSP